MAVRLTLRDLTLEYPSGASALDGLDLVADEGELIVLLGPSGCGKTTTLRLIAGLHNPTRGDVLFDDESMLRVPAERRGAVMVFQQHALFPFKTVAENVGFGLRLRRLPPHERTERVEEALGMVRLSGYDDRWPDELSGGERQRVALARALVVKPRLLLLDEPLSSLDPSLREDVRDTICKVQRDVGITTVMVTHDQSEAMAVADRVALLMNGRLRQVGSPRIFNNGPPMTTSPGSSVLTPPAMRDEASFVPGRVDWVVADRGRAHRHGAAVALLVAMEVATRLRRWIRARSQRVARVGGPARRLWVLWVAGRFGSSAQFHPFRLARLRYRARGRAIADERHPHAARCGGGIGNVDQPRCWPARRSRGMALVVRDDGDVARNDPDSGRGASMGHRRTTSPYPAPRLNCVSTHLISTPDWRRN